MTTTTTINDDDIITNDQDIETFSSEDQVYDYLSIQNLNNRFGLDGKGFDTFIVKELMDNALDFIDQNAKEFVNGKEPFIDVDISQDIETGVTKIRFRNSNAGINNLFSKEEISNIFNLNKYYSSKRYRHKINRGELGDAFKAILGIPYAIAIDDESGKYQDWDYPLEINISNDKRAIKIRIDNIDKIRRKEEFKVKNTEDQFHNSNEEINDFNQFTEIVVYLPTTAVNYDEISNLLKRYVVENTYIDFNFKIWPIQFSKSYLPIQKIVNGWKNKLSIYSYSLTDFKYLIYSLEKSKDNLNIYDYFLHTSFREGWRLKRDEFFNTLTYDDLKKDNKKIEEVYNRLKDTLPPIKDQSTSLTDLELPFDMKKKEREIGLKERLKQVYKIEDDSFAYKKFDKYYENLNGNDVQFPYKLEIVIAKSPILKQKHLTLIESVNCSPSLHSTSLFQAKESIFEWIEKNNKSWITNNILSILQTCGYSNESKDLHKKDGNLITINLISPRIDYKSHSKSDIDLKPFAYVIGQDIYNFCKTALSRNKSNSEETIENNLYHLRIWLKERWEAVQLDPDLLITGRITLDGVYYRLRTRLDQLGIKIKDRDYIKTQIREICEKEMGLKRSQLGIIAAERAQLYFKGRTYSVGIDDISELAKKAADIIIIEKQGAVEALTTFADKQGIGLLYTRGFSTEYALELIEKTNSNIIVLTDLDASGLLIQTKLPSNENKKIYRVGVSQEMLDHFGLNFKDVSESYKPQEGHYDTVAEYLEDNDYNLISKELFERIEKERVEIDSVLSQVTNEDFWEYIINFLAEKFEYRNYNRTFDVPELVTPGNIQKFIGYITNVVSKAQEPERQNIINELAYTEEIFEDIEEEKEKIDNRLIFFAENDPEVKKLISMVDEMNTKYFN